ncbi:MAG: DUF4831 family protein, partial [Acidobacteria bacterium]|nr:DUF4831 family protein [Acidobacteriota bacterium]
MQPRSLFPALFLLPVLFQAGCSSKFVVRKLPPNPGTGTDPDGIVYTLPRTVVRTTVPVIRTDAAEGQYVEFAEFFFPEAYRKENMVMPGKAGKSFRVDKPGFETASEQDPAEIYYVKLSRRVSDFEWFNDRSGKLEISASGTLTSGEVTVTNIGPELAIAAASLATGILTRTALATPLGAGAPSPEVQKKLPTYIEACKKYILSPTSQERQFFDEIASAPGLDDFPAQQDQQTFCELREPLTTKCDYDFIKNAKDLKALAFRFRRAAAAWRSIRDLGEALERVISSSTAAQPAQSRAEIEALLTKRSEELFLGTAKEKAWTPIFPYRPGTHGQTVLFSLDPEKGVCPLAPEWKQEGLVVPSAFASSTCEDKSRIEVRLALERSSPNELSETARLNFTPYNPANPRGFPHRIPSITVAKVLSGSIPKESTERVWKERGRATLAASSRSIGTYDYSPLFARRIIHFVQVEA